MKYLLVFIFDILVFKFSLNAQSFSFSPSIGKRGEIIHFVIKGNHTHFLKNAATLSIVLENTYGDTNRIINTFTVKNDTLIEGDYTVPKYTLNWTYEIALYGSPEGDLKATEHFFINGSITNPLIVSITPSTVKRGDTVQFIIKCRNTQFKLCGIGDPRDYYLIHAIAVGTSNRLGLFFTKIINDSTLLAESTIPIYANDGSLNLTITTPIDGDIVLNNAISIQGGLPKPYIKSIFPTSGNRGDIINLNILAPGSRFLLDDTIHFIVSLTGIGQTKSIKIINDSVFQCKLHIGNFVNDSTIVDIFINAMNESSMTLTNAFSVIGGKPKSSIISCTPSNGKRGEIISYTLKTSGTQFTMLAPTDIEFGICGPVSDILIVNDTVLKGSYLIPASNSDDTISISLFTIDDDLLILDRAFVVHGGIPLPKIVSITPAIIDKNKPVSLEMLAANSHFIQDSVDLFFSQGGSITTGAIEINSIIVLSPIKLIANVIFKDFGPYGKYDLSVSDRVDGNFDTNDILTLRPLKTESYIDSVFPFVFNPGKTYNITVKGKNTHFMYNSTNISFYGPIQILQNTILDDTTLSCLIVVDSQATPGFYQFSLFNNVDGFMLYLNDLEIRKNEVVQTVSDQKDFITIYPNPSSGDFTINSHQKILELNCFNSIGERVYNETFTDHKNSTFIALKGKMEGVYLIRIKTDFGEYSRRIIIN